MKTRLYHCIYLFFVCLPKGKVRGLLWSAFCKFGLLDLAPNEWYWKLLTYIVTGERYALPGKGGGVNSLVRWQQLYWESPLKAKCADKYAVREYVKEKIGQKYLNPLLPSEHSFWTDPYKIDFTLLPDRFVLKLNNGSGMNLLVKDKSKLDIEATREKLRQWLETDFGSMVRELHYREIQNKIICEEFIDTSDGKAPLDYKIMCSNGVPLFVWVDSDRFGEHKRTFYDINFNKLEVTMNYESGNNARPSNWDEMLEIAAKLSKDIPVVRIDLYNIAGRIIFSEMTFTSDQGAGNIQPLSASIDFVSNVDLSPFLKK